MRRIIVTMLAIVIGLAVPAWAQQTSGNITGRLMDAQGSAVPGVTVTARNTQTGLVRTDTSDVEGMYRLTALPVGVYDITAELQGFSKVENKGIVVSVAQTLDVNMTLKVASVSETVTVTGASPLIETSSSSVGGVVDIRRIESLPLNGRQFANLAATIPGVGLGFHTDPTKSTQYSPQINGGNGRNVNYLIDGGDNNDDTVGGLLQLFPLEAIQEFNFQTSRYRAEYGRSVGGVMNVVTKSGTNKPAGSAFESFRDKSLNPEAHSETTTLDVHGNPVGKQDYRRNQFGGSFGGPIDQDKAHFFAAVGADAGSDAFQPVNTGGLFPEFDGSFARPYRENLFQRQGRRQPRARASISRSGTAGTRTSSRTARALNSSQQLGDQRQPLQLDQPESQLGPRWVEAERVHLSVRRFPESHRPASSIPYQKSSRTASPRRRTAIRRRRPSSTSSSSATTSRGTAGGGLGHDFKAGVNFINEPRLFITFNSAKGDPAVHPQHNNDPTGPISTASLNDGDSPPTCR